MIEEKLRIAYFNGSVEEGKREAAKLSEVLGEGYEVNSGRYEQDFKNGKDSLNNYDLLLMHPRNLEADESKLSRDEKKEANFWMYVTETILRRHLDKNVSFISHIQPKTYTYPKEICGKKIKVYFIDILIDNKYSLIKFIKGLK